MSMYLSCDWGGSEPGAQLSSHSLPARPRNLSPFRPGIVTELSPLCTIPVRKGRDAAEEISFSAAPLRRNVRIRVRIHLKFGHMRRSQSSAFFMLQPKLGTTRSEEHTSE